MGGRGLALLLGFERSKVFSIVNSNRPIRLTLCCTQFKPFGNKRFASGISISFKCEFHIIERFSFDLEMKTYEQNRNNKREETELRFDWFIERIQTRVAFDWLSELSVKKLHAVELSRNRYFTLT